MSTLVGILDQEVLNLEFRKKQHFPERGVIFCHFVILSRLMSRPGLYMDLNFSSKTIFFKLSYVFNKYDNNVEVC